MASKRITKELQVSLIGLSLRAMGFPAGHADPLPGLRRRCHGLAGFVGDALGWNVK